MIFARRGGMLKPEKACMEQPDDPDNINPHGPSSNGAPEVAATAIDRDGNPAKWMERAYALGMQQFSAFGAASIEMTTVGLRMNPVFHAWKRRMDAHYVEQGFSPAARVFKNQAEIYQYLPPGMDSYVAEQIRTNGDWHEAMHSPQAAAWHEFLGTILPGRSQLYDDYNHQFLTEDGHGNIRPVELKEIDALFPRDGDGKFPHVLLVPNHVRAETLKDVTELTHGVAAMARDSQDGQELNIAHVNGKITGEANSTVTLFACDTEQNPFLNSAALLRRLKDLQQIARTGEPDRFTNASPGAKRMAGIILREMAQNPEDVEILREEPFVRLQRQPLPLRADPERVAQHFQLIGYSKGGNVVSDAMRYLVTQLSDAQGRPLVQLGEGHTVRNLVRNIACMSIAALEVKMEERYKEQGVRRVSFNNENDVISGHMDFDSSWADHKWKIKGTAEHHGHDPEDALGTKEGRRGYVLDDPHVARVIKECVAPLYGKAAVSSISFEHPLLANDNTVLLGTAPGTPDELLMSYSKEIARRLSLQGLHHVSVEPPNAHNGRAFFIRADEPIRTQAYAIKKLQKGVESLRSKTQGLVIADMIMERNFPDRLAAVGTGLG
jgi:hypothetical protein